MRFRDRHVRRDGKYYLQAFLALLPKGIAWPRKPDSVLVKTSRGLTNIWGFVDSRAADLLEIESDATKTTEILDWWERAWGLPDPCFPPTQSIEARRNMLVFKITLLGGQSRLFFQKISAWTGKVITITEFAPFMVGVSELGDTRYEYDNSGEYRWYLGPEELRFYWTVGADDAVLDWFRCGTGDSELGVHHHLEIYTETPLDCLLRRWQPAHTQMVFDYSSLADAGPWTGLP